jgi:hypothetical protein
MRLFAASSTSKARSARKLPLPSSRMASVRRSRQTELSGSYNNGAGMSRLLTLAAFVRHNMPVGTTFDACVKSIGPDCARRV